MDFEDFTVAEKLSAILQIKKLREEEAKLVEAAKAEALAKTREGIEELNILGFNYELLGPGKVHEHDTYIGHGVICNAPWKIRYCLWMADPCRCQSQW